MFEKFTYWEIPNEVPATTTPAEYVDTPLAAVHWEQHTAGLESAQRIFAADPIGQLIIASEIRLSQEKTNTAVLSELVRLDPLTGAYNRRGFDDRYSRILNEEERRTGTRSASYGTHSLLFIDGDRFKTINDTFGHAAGDQVLKLIVQATQHNLRDQDVVARFGGEEFTVLLPHTNELEAAAVAERIRSRTEEHCPITVSIGVAQVDPDQSLETNLSYADKAVYAAKDKGRNCVVVASQLTDGES
jgi:diguanylate cyclase (GGDEF)-like protein